MIKRLKNELNIQEWIKKANEAAKRIKEFILEKIEQTKEALAQLRTLGGKIKSKT